MTPDLHAYAWVVVNSSGGKDSQTALRATVRQAEAQGYPLDRVVVSHQDLGRMEWPGTRAVALAQASHYGLRFEVSEYRDRKGQRLDLLAMVRRRGKWPSNAQRYCTSECKRGPGNRVITRLGLERRGPVLQVFGFRSEESPARAKRKVLAPNPRASCSWRPVTDWLPIHDWTERMVWDDIRASGVAPHPAYALGMPRLSCIFCIFAPRNALLLAGTHNRALLNEFCDVEDEIGHTFQNGKPISDIRAALRAGEKPGSISGAWNM